MRLFPAFCVGFSSSPLPYPGESLPPRSQALLGNARLGSSASAYGSDSREAELRTRAFPSRAWERGASLRRFLLLSLDNTEADVLRRRRCVAALVVRGTDGAATHRLALVLVQR